MEETKTSEQTTDEAKTFTQEELNAIVSERIARVKAKYEGFEELKAKADKFDELEEANKSELQKANDRAAKLEAELASIKKSEEIRLIKEKIATETGIPASLLTGETEDACREQAEAIKAYAMPSSYPTVRDAGEIQGNPQQNAKRQFADWAAQAF